MENSITGIALGYYSEEGISFVSKLKNEDIEIAQQIIDILAESELPICIATDILEFCRYALGFSRIEKPGRI